MMRGMPTTPFGRALLSGALLATGLVLSSWLVTPGPRLDGAFPRFLALNTTCELLIWGALVVVTNRVFAASALFGLLTAMVVVVSNIKYQYSGVVALPVDAFAVMGIVRDLGVFREYLGYHLREALALIVLVGLVVLTFVKERPLLGWSWRSTVARFAYLALVVWIFYPVTSWQAPVQRAYAAMGESFEPGLPNETVRNTGLFAHLLATMPALFADPPDDFGDTHLFWRHYQSMTASEGSPDLRPASLPNIVVVLSESLFDPRRLRLTIQPEPLTTLDRMSAEAEYHGLLRVHTLGGGTVQAEYGLLTGIPPDLLGPAGSWPFYTLVDESTWSLVAYLKNLGYRTVVIYPVPGSLFNAHNAYSLLGFDEILDMADFDPNKDFGPHHVNDSAIAEKIIETIGESDRPVFVFALTMETHGPWSAQTSAAAPHYRVEGHASPDALAMVEDYVHRLRDVEAMATTIRDSLEGRSRRYVFALFGDHLPAMFDLFDEVGFREDLPRWGDPLWETPYFVQGNVHPEREPELASIDIGFLGSLVLDAAGINGDESFRMGSVYRRFCGGSFMSCRQGDEFRRSYMQILFDRIRDERRQGRLKVARQRRPLLPRYRLGDLVEAGSEYYGAGWSPEVWGVWSVDSPSYIDMQIEGPADADVVLAARVRPSAKVDRVELSANGRPLVTWEFAADREEQARTVVIPRQVISSDGALRLRFDVSRPASPRELGISQDGRRLGIAIYELRVCARSEPACVHSPT